MLGLVLEFVLTLIMAKVYILAAYHMNDLRRFWWIMGPAYGIVVMVVTSSESGAEDMRAPTALNTRDTSPS